jgi:hypothetical protein
LQAIGGGNAKDDSFGLWGTAAALLISPAHAVKPVIVPSLSRQNPRSGETMKTLIIAILAALLAMTALPASAATEKLPDLKMKAPSGFYIEQASNGEKRLRFKTVMWNAGAGKFGVRMMRPDTSTPTMTVAQRVYRTDGTFRTVNVPDTYGFYAGDGHDHWHVFKLQEFTIRKVNADGTTDSVIQGRGAKTGFCFTDNTKVDLTLPGAPSSPHYLPGVACGTESSLKVVEGISVGWGDTYGANLAYQWIKINGLADGKYRVQVIADPGNKFLESNDSNNTNSAYIKISGNTVSLASPSA